MEFFINLKDVSRIFQLEKYFRQFVIIVNLILINLCSTNGFLFTDITSGYLASELPLN